MADSKHKNFKYLNNLIQKGEKEIILDFDIILDEDEKETYLDGIKIGREVTIDANGHFIDGKNNARIFDVIGHNVTLKNIVFRNGYCVGNGGAIVNKGVLKLSNCEFSGCISDGMYGGGAIFNWGGFLIIDDCRFSHNLAFGDFGGAGAISNDGKSIIMDSCFLDNKSIGDYGGGAIISRKVIKIVRSKFSANHAEYMGGAVRNDGGEMDISQCEFLDNTASRGGAIYSNNSAAVLEMCRFGNNRPDNVFEK